MAILVSVCIAVLCVFFAFGCLRMLENEKKQRKHAEIELAEAEQKYSEVLRAYEKVESSLNTGSPDDDFYNANELLHCYSEAQKRRMARN